MRAIFTLFLIVISIYSHAQASLDLAISGEMLSYKFKNTSDPYISAALHISDTSPSGFIKEGIIGYSRLYNTDNIVAGVLLGKKINKWSLRSGVKLIGLLDIDASTDIHLHFISGYQVTDHISLHAQYSWLTTATAFHTFGISSIINLRRFND
jgi:hypothetical protein